MKRIQDNFKDDSKNSNSLTKSALWSFEEGIRIGWGTAEAHVPQHEPMYFLRASGNAGDNEVQLYNFRRSRAYLEYLAELGCTQVWFNWWKGCGLEHERQCMKEVAALFPICKELKLRAICYVSLGSLTPDTILLEKPEAEEWMTETQNGGRASCQVSHQAFRCRPCYTSDGYLSYMEKMLAECLDAGADGIHFDNIGMQAEPEACHCDRCTKEFRKFLQNKYGGELGLEIFGMSDFSFATVPWFNQHNNANNLKRATVPIQRAWIDFKCEIYAKATSRLIDQIRNKKPDAFVEMNLIEADGFAVGFWRGNDYSLLMPKLEMVCDEKNRQDGLNKQGAVVGAYRAKKWARAFGCAHNSGTNIRQLASQFAEDLAFSNAPKIFWDKYKNYQLRSVSCAEVAVLRDQLSLRYNRFEPFEETLAVEQYLIERCYPFDFISNIHLVDIKDQYKLIILAGVEVISNATRDTLLRWVESGGNLLITGNTGMYDEHYRLRRHPVFKVESLEQYREALKPCNAFFALIGEDPHGGKSDTIVCEHGKGRFAWVRGLDFDRIPRSQDNWMIPFDVLMLPRNAKQIDLVMANVLLNGTRLNVHSKASLYVHHSYRIDTGEELIHLINHSYPSQIADAEVIVKKIKDVESIFSLSLDEKETNYPLTKVNFEIREAKLFINVKDIKHHKSLIIKWK